MFGATTTEASGGGEATGVRRASRALLHALGKLKISILRAVLSD